MNGLAETAVDQPRGATDCTFRALGVEIRLVVDEPDALPIARDLLSGQLATLDLACSRFRDDSEIAVIDRAGGRPVAISGLLTEALAVALDAARETDGDVDPTVGQALSAAGYDRDFALLPPDGPAPAVVLRRLASWRSVELDVPNRIVRVPARVRLDLGATAKAFAADRAAQFLHAVVGGSVLVGLGGDIAVAGPGPLGGWPVRVQDRPGALVVSPDGPSQTIAIRGGGLATSSTTVRRWRRGGQDMHHLIDPRTGMPALAPWRTVSVCAASALAANVASTALLVRGGAGLSRLERSGLPARLVTHAGEVIRLNGWPAP
jgi:thiamine biosynthesis lipoprotein ApbE